MAVRQISSEKSANPETEPALFNPQVFTHAVLDALPGLVAYIDRDFKYHYANVAHERWFGVSQEFCLKSHVVDVIGPRAFALTRPFIDAAMTGKSQEFERLVDYQSGGQRYVRTQYLPDTGADGETRGVIVLAHDMTEEKAAIARSVESETIALEDRARLYALFNQSADAMMTLVPPFWKFNDCNPAALKLFKVVDQAAFQLLGPWDISPGVQTNGKPSADEAAKMVQIAMATGSHLFDWIHVTTAGDKIPCKVLLSRIDHAGASYLQATVRDISKEQSVLSELKSKTDELNGIYLNAPIGIIELDSDLKIVRSNPAFQALSEYSEQELLGLSAFNLRHPENKDLLKPGDPGYVKTGNYIKFFESRYIAKSGKTLWARVAAKLLNEPGKPVRYICTVENVTEQRESEIETGTILETMGDGVVIQNNVGKIEKFNPSALKLLGLTEDQLLGRTSYDPRWQAVREDGSAFEGKDHPATVALRTGEPVKDSIMGITRPEGQKLWIRINAVPFEGPSGRQVACTFSDITDLLNAQREIRFILDALKIGVWKFNPKTQELFWDKSMYDVFDRRESDFSGHYQAWESTLTPESKSKAVEELAQALRGEKEFNTVFEIMTETLGKRFISGRGTVIRDKTGEPTMMFGLNADVTDQIKMKNELELERAKSLRNAKLASLGEMSAGVAHEINNPLAIISGAASLLSKVSQNPEKLASKIESIKKSCDRIARIVVGLRKFSRTGEKSNLQIHRLSSIASEAVTLTEIKSKRHETPVLLECSSSTLILCDEIEIEQVLVNLINNAIDAVKLNDERWVKVQMYEEAGSAVVRVTDSGSGIPEDVRNRLFDPFFTTKKTGEGTGLGLSISKGILDELKATIHILPESPNTCFEIRFQPLGADDHGA